MTTHSTDINAIRRKKKFIRVGHVLLLLGLIYFPIFYNLDSLPIRIYDESRVAINALEMTTDHEFFVPKFHYSPDMWNTKPPFLVWMQMICMEVLGPNELAVRLPTAIAVLGTCIMLVLICRRYLHRFWLGFIAALTLVTTYGYMDEHIGRTGDYDAMLTFFNFCAAIFFFLYAEKKSNKYLTWFFVSVTLACMTKGIAGLLFGPAYLLYVLFTGQLMHFLRSGRFWIHFACFLVVFAGMYLLREMQNPGYISTMINNEWGSHYFESQDDVPKEFLHYINKLIDDQMTDRYMLVPIGMIIGLSSANRRLRRISIYLTLVTITFLTVLSVGQTRLHWYVAPAFPLMAFFIALVPYQIFTWLQQSDFFRKRFKWNPLPVIFLFGVFLVPYRQMFKMVYDSNEKLIMGYFYDPGYFMRDAVKGKFDVNGFMWLYDGYIASNLFYARILNDRGVDITFKHRPDVKPGCKVLVQQDSARKFIQNNFYYQHKGMRGTVDAYTITAVCPQNDGPAPAEYIQKLEAVAACHERCCPK